MEKRNSTRGRIINYMLNHPVTSKAELAKELNISMPTVLTNVNELIAQNLLTELGEYESTGGRKAKSIGINKSYRRAMGVVISANHLEMVLINLGSEIEKSERVRLKFSTDFSYCMEVKKEITKFLRDTCGEEELLGIGIAIPGIIDQENRIVMKSSVRLSCGWEKICFVSPNSTISPTRKKARSSEIRAACCIL